MKAKTGTGRITSDQQAVFGLHHHKNQITNSSIRRACYGKCMEGKASVTVVFVVPTQEGVEAVRTFLKATQTLWKSRGTDMGL